MAKQECSTSGGIWIIACAGSSDVGTVADMVARGAARDPNINNCCILRVVHHDKKLLGSLESARFILTIDGCEQDCAHRLMQEKGLRIDGRMRLTDQDLRKGHSTSHPKRVRQLVSKVKNQIRIGLSAAASK